MLQWDILFSILFCESYNNMVLSLSYFDLYVAAVICHPLMFKLTPSLSFRHTHPWPKRNFKWNDDNHKQIRLLPPLAKKTVTLTFFVLQWLLTLLRRWRCRWRRVMCMILNFVIIYTMPELTAYHFKSDRPRVYIHILSSLSSSSLI